MVQLAGAWKRVATDNAIRVARITGAGDKAYDLLMFLRYRRGRVARGGDYQGPWRAIRLNPHH